MGVEMMTEDELKAIIDYYQQYSTDEMFSALEGLVAEVRRLNTAYETLMSILETAESDESGAIRLDVFRLFQPDEYKKYWADIHYERQRLD